MELMGSSVLMLSGCVKSIGTAVHFWRFRSLGGACSQMSHLAEQNEGTRAVDCNFVCSFQGMKVPI